MGYEFTAKEIFEMAGQIERNGAAFYENAARRVAGESEKKFLSDLAEMERQHEQIFAEMERQLTNSEKIQTVFDPDNETAQYLTALADTRIFFEKEMDASSMTEIWKSAIAAEKDSIVFYLGMKELVPEKFGKNRLDAIIKEEMGHIRMLGRELAGRNV